MIPDADGSDRAFDQRETFLTKRYDSCRPSLSMRNKMKQSNDSLTLTSGLRGLQGRDITSDKSSISKNDRSGKTYERSVSRNAETYLSNS